MHGEIANCRIIVRRNGDRVTLILEDKTTGKVVGVETSIEDMDDLVEMINDMLHPKEEMN